MSDLGSALNPIEGGVGVLVVIDGRPTDWLDSIRSLRGLPSDLIRALYVASVDIATTRKCLAGSGVEVLDEWTLSSASIRLLKDFPRLEAILVVTAPVAVSPDLLDRALEAIREDPRIATTSFLSNAAGHLSFPYRNTPTGYPITSLDERGVTRKLRETAPASPLVPIALPGGSAVLVSQAAFAMSGRFDSDLDAVPSESIAEFALRSSRRGFQHRLDSQTYVTAQWFEGFPALEAASDDAIRHRLHVRDSSFPALYDQQRTDLISPLAMALDVARSKVEGLRILVDGSCLGPLEMGTQVQTLALIRALTARMDVAFVGVGVPSGRLPEYAKDLLVTPKVRLYDSDGLMFAEANEVDILHRPFQAHCPIPWGRWRSLAKRVIVTLQDLIAYRIGAYHYGGGAWLEYREYIAAAAKNSDAIIAISDDTKTSIIEERLCIAADDIHVVKNGGNHLGDQSDELAPVAMMESGLITSRFLLVLGASYAHKNRDFAIRVWRELRGRGHNLSLVMAGATVTKGSSRVEEAVARMEGEEQLITMPDVSGEERTWLLRHAALVLYPTSAEGFGLIPFEAAALGTPTAYVSFGPLRELIDAPFLPRTWSVEGVADFSEKLLTDPMAASECVRTILSQGEELTWAVTAEDLVAVYRTTLANPRRW